MARKHTILIASVALLTAFALGRYTASQGIVKQETTAKVEKKKDKNTQTKRTTITTKSPTGEVKTITTVDTITKSTSQSESEKTSITKRKSLNISGLLGYDYKNPAPAPLYGLSVTTPIVGPVTGGAWMLNNGTIGLSVGLDF